MNITEPRLEKYSLRHSAPEPKLFRELARVTYKTTDWPQMQVGHLEGSFLRLLVQLTGAKNVLEIGTFTGYSALAMAEGLAPGGKLVTCDINPETSRLAQKFWNKSPHGRKIHLVLGPAVETLKRIKGTLDFVFIDADKDNYVNYWNLAVPKLRKGGLIVADNVLWSGAVLNPKTPMDKAIVRFNKHALRDRRMECVMLPVRDGMTLARKR